jgi:hypothetical protein
MILQASAQRMTRPLLLIAAADVVLAQALWGQTRAIAALIGASLAVANWFALRFLAGRLVGGSGNRAALSILLMAKIGLLMALVYILINRLHVDPVGLAFGLGVLFLGPALAGLLTTGAQSAPSLNPSAAPAAREER